MWIISGPLLSRIGSVLYTHTAGLSSTVEDTEYWLPFTVETLARSTSRFRVVLLGIDEPSCSIHHAFVKSGT
jgi:hypothetical protein